LATIAASAGKTDIFPKSELYVYLLSNFRFDNHPLNKSLYEGFLPKEHGR
jgi:hypothetical protein